MGHKRTFCNAEAMSALAPKADMCSALTHVRFVIGGNKAERRPRAGKEWLAATEHDGVEVESILINKTKVGYASC